MVDLKIPVSGFFDAYTLLQHTPFTFHIHDMTRQHANFGAQYQVFGFQHRGSASLTALDQAWHLFVFQQHQRGVWQGLGLHDLWLGKAFSPHRTSDSRCQGRWAGGTIFDSDRWAKICIARSPVRDGSLGVGMGFLWNGQCNGLLQTTITSCEREAT
jgi:hypothetical protein